MIVPGLFLLRQCGNDEAEVEPGGWPRSLLLAWAQSWASLARTGFKLLHGMPLDLLDDASTRFPWVVAVPKEIGGQG